MNSWINKFYLVILISTFYLLDIIFKLNLLACPVYKLLGIPCPTCGMTRSYLALLDGDIKLAFMYHPLFLLVPVVILLFIFSEFINPKKYKIIMYTILGLFILVYVVRMILFFPTGEVMNLNELSNLYQIFN